MDIHCRIMFMVLVVTWLEAGMKPTLANRWDIVRRLESPRVTNFGNWGNWVYCPNGEYVVGVELIIEDHQGQGAHGAADDTALNGILLYCGDLGGVVRNGPISSTTGPWGFHRGRKYCEGVAMGFELRSEVYQGGGSHDDAAAIDFKLLCVTPTVSVPRPLVGGGSLSWGYWSGEQRCPTGSAICGIQTQVEPSMGIYYDDSSLNNVKMACCSVPSPASLCTPNHEWRQIFNCGGLYCSYTAGTSFTTTVSNNRAEDKQQKTSWNLGVSAGAEKNALKATFEAKYGREMVEGRSYSTLIQEAQMQTRTMTVASNGSCHAVEQFVLLCGSYAIENSIFRCASYGTGRYTFV